MSGYEKSSIKDPVFSKALRLLHSEAEDSADQLKALLEEAIAQKYGASKKLNIDPESTTDEEEQIDVDVVKSPENESEASSAPNIESEDTIEVVSRETTPQPTSDVDSERTSPDENGFLPFDEENICSVCDGVAVSEANVLVECSDCHLKFHQDCHEPVISDSEVTDPRLVWYCSSCRKKNLEKIHIKIKTNPTDPSKTKCKVEVIAPEKNTSLFKRNEKTTTGEGSKTPGGGGMAHLAASIQCSKVTSSAGTSSSTKASLNYSKTPGSPKSQSSSSTAPVNIIAADKRIQNMKKKAAAKMQEKRVKLK